MNKNNEVGILGIVITIILLIILVILSNVNIEKLSYIEGAVSKIVTPIQNGITIQIQTVILEQRDSKNYLLLTFALNRILNLQRELSMQSRYHTISSLLSLYSL